MNGGLAVINLIANLVIVAGYILVPIVWHPLMKTLTVPVLASGVVFFLTCAITHVWMAFRGAHHSTELWLLFNHIVQAAAVQGFVIGFAVLLRRARNATVHHQEVGDDGGSG